MSARPVARSLKIEALRTLDCAPGKELPFIAAASGLVKIADTFWVVADDQNHMGAFRSSGPVELLRVFPGDLPADEHDRKKVKPDLEALIHLSAGTTGLPNDILLALGSGSKPTRHRGVALTVDKQGQTHGAPQVVDLAPLYGALKASFSKLNIEGAAVLKNTLKLAQRGNGVGNTSALIDLDLKSVVSAITNKRPVGGEAIRKIIPIDLGSKQGVAWTITDLAPLANGNLAFTAAAEASQGVVDDGAVIGAALGVITPDGKVLSFTEVDPCTKLEGLFVAAERGAQADVFLVCDADDATKAATLFRAQLPL